SWRQELAGEASVQEPRLGPHSCCRAPWSLLPAAAASPPTPTLPPPLPTPPPPPPPPLCLPVSLRSPSIALAPSPSVPFSPLPSPRLSPPPPAPPLLTPPCLPASLPPSLRPPARRSQSRHQGGSRCSTMTGIAAASFFSNTCRFGGCGLHFPTLADLIEHIEDNHIDTDPRVLEKQELQQPTYVALSYINRNPFPELCPKQELLCQYFHL
uniref:JAZF zinc finger 1 n=1 Tax=Suricata suricatta TaxID=37032 RepID=A0A673V8C2_SURSU